MAEYAILTAEQGTDTTFQVDVVDANRNPRDLTGISVAAKFRKQYNSNIVYEFEDSVATPATDGIIKLHLDAAFTNTIDAGRYFYDVEITTVTDTTERIVEGILEITPAVTQSARAFKASTRRIPVQLGDLTDVDVSTLAHNASLVYDSDQQRFEFGLADIGTLDSAEVLNIADSDYILSVYSAGNNITIDSAGVITSTATADDSAISAALASEALLIDGGSF
jgi:hypothetical protein